METEFTLCRIILPPEDMQEQEEMYFRKKGNVSREREALVFQKGDVVSFGTYFNSMPAGTWRKYTWTGMVWLRVILAGAFRLRLCRMSLQGRRMVRKTLSASSHMSDCMQICEHAFPDSGVADGVLYFELQAQADGCRMMEAEYFTRVPAEKIRPVKLAAGICTYKREAYILKNLALMSRKLSDSECLLHGHMEIFVADNGHTLAGELEKFPPVHGFENPNYGGTAGFARCMLEVLRANGQNAGFTHMLLMDDDVRLEWGSLEKTYALLSLLRPEYIDAFIGGAMLRADMPGIQEESGGIFGNNGNRAINKGFDMRLARDFLENEKENKRSRHADYNAWWYCCFPVRILDRNGMGFPLPLFIHGDDIEWGLRNQEQLIRMNGICVWHEPLEGKASAERLYYDIRNLLICHALHGGRAAGIHMAVLVWKQCIHDAFLFRYRYIRAAIQGVEDFLKGPAFLAGTDAEHLHKKLLSMRYTKRGLRLLRRKIPWEEIRAAESRRQGKLERVCSAILLNGCFLPGAGTRFLSDGQAGFICAWHSRRLIFVDENKHTFHVREYSAKQFVKAVCLTMRTTARLVFCYGRLAAAYRAQSSELMTREFWETYLNMTEIITEDRRIRQQ